VKGWAAVFRGPRVQADLLQAVLEAAGLKAVQLHDAGDYAGEFFDARVFVPEEQAPEARRLISEAGQAGGP